jgi:hypothetical protein
MSHHHTYYVTSPVVQGEGVPDEVDRALFQPELAKELLACPVPKGTKIRRKNRKK